MANAVVDVLRPVLDSLTSALRRLTSGLEEGLVSAGDTALPAATASGVVVARRRCSAPVLATGLALVGAVTLISWAMSAANFLYPYIRPSRLRRFHHGGPQKPWAVVTGASDGIGKGFAQELAAACFNVVLVARNKDKLALTAREIEYDFPGTMVRVVVANAGNLDQTKFLAELDATVAGLPGPVTVLINNVGRTSSRVDTLSGQDDYDLADIVVVNDVFPTLITKHLLPALVKNQPSLILNVGSYASEIAFLPYMSVYSGSKAYNKVWSQSLHNELRMTGADGVECQHLLVGTVHTNMNRTSVGIFCPDGRKFARAALRVSTRRPVIAPYFPHALQNRFLLGLPRCASEWLVMRIVNEMKRKADQPVYVEAV